MTNQIVSFFHCANCMKVKPANKSPREWAMLEVGWTKKGFQVWCKRCEMDVIHVDFEGQKVVHAEDDETIVAE